VAWQLVGRVTVGPFDDVVEVGPIEVPTAGGFEFSVRQVAPTPFRWGNGLVSFVSSQGRELGTAQVWPKVERESYYLGANLTVLDNSGVLIFEPRLWNLRWVRAGFPLELEFLADLATDLPPDRFRAPGFTQEDGAPLVLQLAGTLGRLLFGP
jgi:hypothetical protein